jgi:EpsI family protein
MIAAAILATALTPTKLTAASIPKLHLDTMIPKQFGDWHQQQELDVISANPEVQAQLDKIYLQTLTRTYQNSRGEQIMLSLAYGRGQNDHMNVHTPEACYPAQGFQILQSSIGLLHLTQSQNNIPVKHLIAKYGERVEPITYWITIGNQTAVSNYQWKWAQLKASLTGGVPDSLLIRVSSIDTNYVHAFSLQSKFVNDLFTALTTTEQIRLGGIANKHAPNNIQNNTVITKPPATI